uniref:SRP9-21 domain-containing protein n=1 Tax=Steinernema glaseri TaxID=37863 RepID=A0A1I7YX00_9BILA
MRDRQLEVAKVEEDQITLKYVTLQKVTLRKLEPGEARSKLKKLLFSFVSELISMKKQEGSPSKAAKPARSVKPPTVIEKTANQSSFDATKRKRRMPKGIVFTD